MATTWVPAPRQAPARCFLTGLSSREHGPYLEIDAPPGRPYIDPVTRKEGRMYWSFVSWRTTVLDKDGPYRVIIDEEVARQTAKLTARIEELEAKIASDPVLEAFKRFHETVKQVPPPPLPDPPMPELVTAEAAAVAEQSAPSGLAQRPRGAQQQRRQRR